MNRLVGPIVSAEQCQPGLHRICFDAPGIASESRPGQFVTVRCGADTLMRRPFSIHRVIEQTVELLFRTVGPGTHWLSEQVPGGMLDILGPLGNGFEVHSRSHNLLLVAGGVGIAPLCYLAEHAVENGYAVRLVTGATDAYSLLPYAAEGVNTLCITEDGSKGKKGKATDCLPEQMKWADQVFACGPVPMYRTMASLEGLFEGKSVQVLVEQVMGCGVGACRGCAVPTRSGMRMVCQDGPVFEMREINWERLADPGIKRLPRSAD